MSSELQPRKSATKTKHYILSEYLAAWSGIIVQGLRGLAAKVGPGFQARFIYVDCFSSMGRYRPEGGEALIFGSPIIGIQNLDNLIPRAHQQGILGIETNSILIEQNKGRYTALLESLRLAGLGERLRNTHDFQTLKNGEIAVINGDCREYRDQLLSYT